MPKLHQQDSWPTHHRNQVPIIEYLIAQVAALTAHYNELADRIAADNRKDDQK